MRRFRAVAAVTAAALLVPAAGAAAQDDEYDGSATTEGSLDPAAPDGDNGWYVSDVSLELESDDDAAELQWRHYGDPDWIDYTEPPVIDVDGQHRLVYRDARPYFPWDLPDGVVIDPPPTHETIYVSEGQFGRSLYMAAQGAQVAIRRSAGEHILQVHDEDGNLAVAQADVDDWQEEEVNNEWTNPYTREVFRFSIEEEGTYTITCLLEDMEVELLVSYNPLYPGPAGALDVHIDQTPPVTSAEVTGPPGYMPGVFAGHAFVELEATDDGSGVAESHVRLAGEDGYDVVDGPFEITGEGTHTVEFRSKDVAGNLEDWQRIEVTVDGEFPPMYRESDPPEVTVTPSAPDGDNGWYTSDVTFELDPPRVHEYADRWSQWREYGVVGWIDYATPVTITEDGDHRLVYRMADWTFDVVYPGEPRTIPYSAEVLLLDEQVDPGSGSIASIGGPITFTRAEGDHDIVVQDPDGNEVAAQAGDDWELFEFSAEKQGIYTFTCAVVPDMGGEIVVDRHTFLQAPAGVIEVPMDQTPPETTAEVNGTPGDAPGTFTGSVTVHVFASDETSGVAESHVRVAGDDGYDVVDGSFEITGEGTHTVEFRSKDVAGNLEDWQRIDVVINGSLPAPTNVCEEYQGGVTFADAPGSGHRFFIDCLAELGIVEGYGDGTYGSADEVSRGQLASFVVRALERVGFELEADASFPDVEAGATHSVAVAKLASAGIVQGYPDGAFRSQESVSREQTATYVAGAIELVAGSELETGRDTFSDVSGTHARNIRKLVGASVLDGFPDGTFRPTEAVTRAQMAKFIGNALGVLGTRGHLPQV